MLFFEKAIPNRQSLKWNNNGTCRAALHFSISIRLPALSPTITGSLFYGDNRRETSAARAGTHGEILRIYIGIQFNSSHSLNSTRKWMSLAPDIRYRLCRPIIGFRQIYALNLNMDEPEYNCNFERKFIWWRDGVRKVDRVPRILKHLRRKREDAMSLPAL